VDNERDQRLVNALQAAALLAERLGAGATTAEQQHAAAELLVALKRSIEIALEGSARPSGAGARKTKVPS
jgi:hypothetical protein